MNRTSKLTVLFGSTALLGTMAQASSDYGPAIYRPMSGCSKWYTTGNGHQFVVIHDMEGYYWTSISYLNTCSVSASIYYLVNGKQDTSTDAPAGEISQSVREANYAWHVGCWNRWMFGTEHEGFASNPAWYTDAMYNATAPLQKHLCDAYGIAKDRNHVIGHNEHSNANWRNWMAANYSSINTLCNTHSDPGPYWDWSRFMNMLAGNNASVVSSTYPSSVTTGQGFSASVVMNNNGGTSWTSGGNYNLGSQNPQDNTRWGLGRVATTGTISPGQNSTYNFNCTAPTTAGTYPFDWKMVQDGVEWFGATATGTIIVSVPQVTVIVDNSDAGFSVTGTWSTGTSSTDKYGSDYRYHSTQATSAPAQWVGNLANSGTYNVYAWWEQGANRSTTAPYIVYDSAGTGHTVNMNQQSGGGAWNLLGSWSMNAGNNTVKLSCWTTTGFNVMADAIKWVQQ